MTDMQSIITALYCKQLAGIDYSPTVGKSTNGNNDSHDFSFNLVSCFSVVCVYWSFLVLILFSMLTVVFHMSVKTHKFVCQSQVMKWKTPVKTKIMNYNIQRTCAIVQDKKSKIKIITFKTNLNLYSYPIFIDITLFTDLKISKGYIRNGCE